MRPLALALLLAVGCSSSSEDSATPNDATDAADETIDTAAAEDVAADTTADTASVAEAATDAGPTTPCWPFDQPSIASLRTSKKKVFAHYFSQFPLSIDNKAPDSDYYAVNYLRPEGEGGKWSFCGGFLRERPLPVEPAPASVDYQARNYDTEVRRAVALGIDGFTYDILSSTGTHWMRLGMLLDAAKRVDPGFHIVLMPDMTSAFSGTDAAARTEIVTAMKSVASHPSVYRLADGKVVISPFGADKRSASWWSSVVGDLKAAGVEVALLPLYVSPWEAATKTLAATVPLYGTSTWGPRTVAGALGLADAAKKAHDLGLVWMAPVAPQDSRPKDLIFTEPTNSKAFRTLWDSAIAGDADWVQLITWNDYSEDSEIAPSSQIHGAFYDLTAYYTTWFKTGVQPTIARDALFYFHRVQDMSIAPDLTKQKNAYMPVNGAAPVNEIELVAFLTAPGTLEIEIGGKVQKADVPAGIQTLRAPIAAGSPKFSLIRSGTTVVSVTSSSPITATVVYQDPLYHAGSSISCVME